MVKQLINEINLCLANECYFSALTMALMLPDICSRAEFPTLEDKVGKRYKRWFDRHIGKWERSPKVKGVSMPCLTGEVVYSLRCSMLHQGTPNITKSKIKNPKCQIDDFVLVIEKEKEFDTYVDSAGIIERTLPDGTIETTRRYRVNVRRLCMIITTVATHYYENNAEKFDFMKFSLMDWDLELAKMKSIGLLTESEGF